jgi:hypothetical protein
LDYFLRDWKEETLEKAFEFFISKGSFLFHTFDQVEESKIYMPLQKENEFTWELIQVWMGLLFEVDVKFSMLSPSEDIKWINKHFLLV